MESQVLFLVPEKYCGRCQFVWNTKSLLISNGKTTRMTLFSSFGRLNQWRHVFCLLKRSLTATTVQCPCFRLSLFTHSLHRFVKKPLEGHALLIGVFRCVLLNVLKERTPQNDRYSPLRFMAVGSRWKEIRKSISINRQVGHCSLLALLTGDEEEICKYYSSRNPTMCSNWLWQMAFKLSVSRFLIALGGWFTRVLQMAELLIKLIHLWYM